MSGRVLIRRNVDGLERWYRDEYADSYAYIWEEGNYGCDCNRALFFARAAEEEEEDDPPCGDTAYTVPYLELDDGTRVWIDEKSGT